MRILKEGFLIFTIMFSSSTLAGIDLNKSQQFNITESVDIIYLSSLQSVLVKEPISVELTHVEYHMPTAHLIADHSYSLDITAFSETLVNPVGFFNLPFPINKYSASPLNFMGKSNLTESTSGHHYQFWSMLLVGLMLIFSQIFAVNSNSTDLKLSRF